MKEIDISFKENIIDELKKMLGKIMLYYECDPFISSSDVYGMVCIMFENLGTYVISNFIRVLDYYGSDEDVGYFNITYLSGGKIKSVMQDIETVVTPVNSIVKEIHIINECQKLFENDIQTYEINLTRGIIFKFTDGLELSFEKDVWFSEEIIIRQGYNLFNELTPVNEFLESWDKPYRGECSRSIIKLNLE